MNDGHLALVQKRQPFEDHGIRTKNTAVKATNRKMDYLFYNPRINFQLDS